MTDGRRPAPVRFDNVNLLRAFAALAVVVYHVIEHGHWSAFPVQGPLVVFRIGWIGVDLFFVISGFVIAYSAVLLRRRDPARFQREYWLRRLTRIVPLYVLTMAAWIALEWQGFFGQPAREWAWQLFTHLAFIHTFWRDTHSAIDGVNWTLAIEMQFYVAIALAIGWIDRTPGWRIWLYGTVVSWAWRACMVVLHGYDDTWELFRYVTQLPGVLDEFGAGIFLAKAVLDGPPPSAARASLWLAGALATGYLAMSAFWPRATYWDFPAMVIFWRTAFAAFLLCVVAAAVELPQAIALRWLRPVDGLGEVSYGIYLWHLFAIQWAIHAEGMTGVRSLVAVLAATVALAALSWRYFEKPLMGLARRN
ncbi:MAG TPA: acyltransferase [Usitatibacter sp.]|nr:acyltransferase [Usitatibacter sp.]